MNFTAEIECGFLKFQVEATINPESEVYIRVILWNGKPLLIDQEINFVESYGLDDLKSEVMTQYRGEMELQAMDQAGLELEDTLCIALKERYARENE